MFLENMKTAATQVGILYVMIIVGFVCDKLKIYTEKTAKATTDLLFYIIVPCVIINSFLNIEYSSEMLKKFLLSLAIGFATHFLGILLNLPLFRRKTDENNPIYKFASIYGNVGFMALPLAQAMLGAEGVFYCSSGVIAFNVVSFTHGVMVMSKEEKSFNLKHLVLNPGVISVAIGLPLFLLRLELPQLAVAPVTYIASMNTPLAMLVFGTFLARADLKTLFTDKKIYLACFMKLLVLPAVALGLYRLLGVTGSLLTASIVTAGVPSANNTVMFSAKYGRDTALASKTVSMTCFFSVLTLPLMIAIAQAIG